MTLKGVLYAPCDEVVNLISVGRIVASKAAVTFAKGCGIITRDDGFTAYAPYTADGLYALADWYPVRPSSDGNSSSSSSVDIGSTSAAMKVKTKQLQSCGTAVWATSGTTACQDYSDRKWSQGLSCQQQTSQLQNSLHAVPVRRAE